MRDGWKAVPVATVVHQVRRRVRVIAGHDYPLLGVRWYGGGPFHRETVTDETSKATQLFRVLEGDFIYNRLFAWKGSFGIIPPQLDGHFVWVRIFSSDITQRSG
jgi:type I restriction enzyme, S subunit